MNTTPLFRRAAPLVALSLSATAIATAQGVVNGDFATSMSAVVSPWVQYYPSGINEAPGSIGVLMQNGILSLEPRVRQAVTKGCPIWADIAVLQAGVRPFNAASNGEIIELEFALRMSPAGNYTCNDQRFVFVPGADVPAFEACVWRGNTGASLDQYQRLGSEYVVATDGADGAWRRHRVAWERGSSDSTTRYMVTLKLADLGESMLLEVDETTGEFVFFRANQVIADVDNVTLTVRSGDAYPCPLIAGGVSLDLINTAGASARPILGGAFSGSGLLEGCGEPCPADVDQDGAVGGSDLGLLIATWGGTGSADIDGDGVVSGVDLGIMLTGWGLCP